VKCVIKSAGSGAVWLKFEGHSKAAQHEVRRQQQAAVQCVSSAAGCVDSCAAEYARDPGIVQ
jgi:hypothetical protein